MQSTSGVAKAANDLNIEGHQDDEYPLSFPRSQRWKPRYNVPRNSLDDTQDPSAKPASSNLKLTSSDADPDDSQERRPVKPLPHTTSFGRTRRDIDTRWVADALAAAAADKQSHHGDGADEELSNLSHWLETLAELYMNELDNRARFDPRWLNITRRERYEGLQSVSITIFDYMTNNSVQRSDTITGSKNQLASALQTRPDDAAVRVILVSDVSRFVMGTLGQMYNVDPEFWFDHLVGSGYSGSDSGLKLKNAVWMNWAGREIHFRHRTLPGPGQRTAWNAPWRTRGRRWAHLRWGRLGLLTYLGLKGFHQDEIEGRLKEGRWLTERDVFLDKRGLLLTEKRLAKLEKRRQKAQKKGKSGSDEFKTVSSRTKTSNVYRAYCTFDGLPRNPGYWSNRDLRVMAPEATSYWPGKDPDGRDIVIILVDSPRSMKNHTTKEITPSLTFMPRPLELESYSDEEWWRTAGPEESYFEPPPVLPTKEELKAQRKAALKNKLSGKATQLQGRLNHDVERDALGKQDATARERGEDEDEDDAESDLSSLTSDSEYDVEDETKVREAYAKSSSIHRDREFARKYALNTHDLISRHLNELTAAEILQHHDDDTDDAAVPPSPLQSLLVQLVLDDMHELATELRLELDHLDSDLADGDALFQLLEASGNTTRQNLHWLRATLMELREWTSHLTDLTQPKRAISLGVHKRSKPGRNADQGRGSPSSPALELSEELKADVEALASNLTVLQKRADASLSLLSSSTGLQQSSLVIDQTSGINKLTELAFFFIPVSFITAVFSMQVRELTGPTPPEFWTWGVALVATLVTTYFIRATLRSPSMRVAALHCRATILNRFTSSKPGSSARRLNTIGNRAIAKFAFFTVVVLGFAVALIVTFTLAVLLLLGGIWISAAAVAIYYIVTRWGEPAVMVPCFISLPLAAAGFWVSWWWVDDMMDIASRWANGALLWFRDKVLPPRYVLDKVDDQDLAKEGVNTYARQAIVMST